MASRAFGPPPGRDDRDGFGLAAVVGHDGARRLLAERARAGSLPHALLVTGPHGVGKRTLAQALAADHFCVERRGCGRCAACGALARGNHPGFVAVACPEGKSAIPIEAIKALEAELSLRPADERGRFVVIDGADRMTPPAQDALLKTLEEPPAGNVLVLTATRPDAVFPTIRSRCQRIALAPLAERELVEVAQRLGLKLAAPASVARGCPGQLERLADPEIDRLRRGVTKLLQEPRGREDLARLIALLHDGLSKEAEAADVRARARLLLDLLGSFARDLVVLRASGAADRVRNSDQLERLLPLTGRAEWSDALDVLARLARARDRVEGNVDPASALFCALHPDADAAALESGI
jgi:DNA polymerase-3 subunit delta'